MTIPDNNTVPLSQQVADRLSEAGNATFGFLYETPTEVVLSLIAGIVLHIFNTSLALPCYGMVGGSLVSRIVLIIISKFDINAATYLIEKIDVLHQKFAYIPVILLISSIALAWFVPFAGLAIGIVIGIYYGAVAEKGRLMTQQIIPDPLQPAGI